MYAPACLPGLTAIELKGNRSIFIVHVLPATSSFLLSIICPLLFRLLSRLFLACSLSLQLVSKNTYPLYFWAYCSEVALSSCAYFLAMQLLPTVNKVQRSCDSASSTTLAQKYVPSSWKRMNDKEEGNRIQQNDTIPASAAFLLWSVSLYIFWFIYTIRLNISQTGPEPTSRNLKSSSLEGGKQWLAL